MNDYPLPPKSIMDTLREGVVIPAHPLALTQERGLDERHQRALTRYYHAAGAGGIAVGVHTTQFEIRDPKYGLLKPILLLAAQTISESDALTSRETVCIAGITGKTPQAMAEARVAADLGYHAGLLSLAALRESNVDELIEHCKEVAKIIPLFGFYLQPAVGGRVLPMSFWRRFVEIPNLIGIKVAPFNRYQTLDVVRAVAEAGREDEIVLYTGNDDHIVHDLLAVYEFPKPDGVRRLHFAGGLLGHWACWTRTAVDLLHRCKQARQKKSISESLQILANQVTDANAAFFDAANAFRGVIPGIHEVLHRQGLMDNIYCLNPEEKLSWGQREQIDRVYQAYPHLNDDDFVRENLDTWLQ